MIKIERILCPIDLSVDSNQALRYAVALARAYDAKLFVLTCTAQLAPVGTLARLETGEEAHRALKRSMDLYVGAAGIAMPAWESVVARGADPAEAITREAAELGADLVVMCSRRRPLRAALLGSVAEAVYRTAPCSVLVTHPDEREWVDEATGAVNLERVLVAHDFSDYSELALRHALSLAQEYQAELHLLHVVSLPILREPELAWAPASTEGAYHKAARGLQKAVPGEAYLWCQVKHAVRWGKPYDEVLSYAREHEIDLICMGAHGSGYGTHTLLGSNVDRVLRQSPCPVLVARPLRPASRATWD